MTKATRKLKWFKLALAVLPVLVVSGIVLATIGNVEKSEILKDPALNLRPGPAGQANSPKIELIEKRTENSKTFDLGNGKRVSEFSMGTLHYKDDYDDPNEPWQDINLTFENNKIDKALYILEVKDLTIEITSKRTGTVQTLTLDKIGSEKPQGPPVWEFADNQATWRNAAPHTDIVIEALVEGVRFKRILKNKNAPLEAVFTHTKTIGTVDDIILPTSARDADGLPLEVVAINTAGKLIETLNSKINLDEVKFPIEIDPSPLIVQPSGKDTYLFQNGATNYGTLTYLTIIDWSGYATRSILEFDISVLPLGVTLDSATLQLYYYLYVYTNPSGKTVWAYKQTHTDWVELQATWFIYKTGSNWATAGGDYVTSNPVGGSTTFPASYGWMSWDVLAICQDAYASSIAAEFLIKFATEGLASGYSQGGWYSNNYTTDPSLQPKLTIAYTEGGGGTTAPSFTPVIFKPGAVFKNNVIFK